MHMPVYNKQWKRCKHCANIKVENRTAISCKTYGVHLCLKEKETVSKNTILKNFLHFRNEQKHVVIICAFSEIYFCIRYLLFCDKHNTI